MRSYGLLASGNSHYVWTVLPLGRDFRKNQHGDKVLPSGERAIIDRNYCLTFKAIIFSD